MKLDVIYASDENYAMYTGVSMCSLLENNKKIDDLNVYIIDNKITEESRAKLTRLGEKYNRRIVFLESAKLFDNVLKNVKMKSTQTVTAYACCFMSELLDDSFERVLYMDGDSLICGDLSPICDIDMTDKYVCGALDLAQPVVREKIGFEQSQPYINSGFLYMDLANIRKADLRDSIMKFIEEVIPQSKHNDQDVINGIMHEHMEILPLKYNVITPLYEKGYDDLEKFYRFINYYTKDEVEAAVKDPVFVHFTASSSRRPWIKGCNHPMKTVWEHYKSLTEWAEVPDKKDNRKPKKKLNDWLYNNLSMDTYMKILRLRGHR